MLEKPRFLYVIIGLMLVVGSIALIDGYFLYLDDETTLRRWLMLPVSQFAIAGALILKLRSNAKNSENPDA